MSRSKYDGLSSYITRNIINKWKTIQDDDISSIFLNIERNNLEFDVHARLFIVTDEQIGFKVINTTGADAREYDDDGDYQTPFILIDFAVNKSWLPTYWSEIYYQLCDVVRHEIEHITQDGKEIGNYRNGKPSEDDSIIRAMINNGLMDQSEYPILPKEIDANLQGLRFESRKRRKKMINTIHNYFNIQGFSINEQDDILKIWRQRAKKIGGIPIF